MNESGEVYAVPELDVQSSTLEGKSIRQSRLATALRIQAPVAGAWLINTQRKRGCSSIKWPAVGGLSAEQRCIHSAAALCTSSAGSEMAVCSYCSRVQAIKRTCGGQPADGTKGVLVGEVEAFVRAATALWFHTFRN